MHKRSKTLQWRAQVRHVSGSHKTVVVPLWTHCVLKGDICIVKVERHGCLKWNYKSGSVGNISAIVRCHVFINSRLSLHSWKVPLKELKKIYICIFICMCVCEVHSKCSALKKKKEREWYCTTDKNKKQNSGAVSHLYFWSNPFLSQQAEGLEKGNFLTSPTAAASTLALPPHPTLYNSKTIFP